MNIDLDIGEEILARGHGVTFYSCCVRFMKTEGVEELNVQGRAFCTQFFESYK